MEKYIEWAKANKGKALLIGFVAFIIVAEIVKAIA